ncbi:hypothetical protein H0H87_005695, partial [Tephrocybe sp. NHM501043]
PTEIAPSVTVFAIGTGSDGATTYHKEAVGSAVLYIEPTRTAVTSGSVVETVQVFVTKTTTYPYTYEATFVEDATHVSYHQEPTPIYSGTMGVVGVTGENVVCGLDGKGEGSCVMEAWNEDIHTTLTSTYTGPASPWYTLEAQGNSAISAVMRVPYQAWGAVAFGVLSGYLLVL